MIYQCYYKKSQENYLFPFPMYKGFGLEPEVNLRLFLNCPELESYATRLALVEYAAMLWHYRNSKDLRWIGFTSFRQLDKVGYVFTDTTELEYINSSKVIAWLEYEFVTLKGHPLTLAKQAEECHPGINKALEDCFASFGESVPSQWYTNTSGFFANYWVMEWEMFIKYMTYLIPKVEWALENIPNTEWYNSQPEYATVSKGKCVGYFLERLFILWYLSEGVKPRNPGVPTLHRSGY